MNAEKLATLKLAANQFYLNKDTDKGLIDDLTYDSLKAEYEAEGGSVVDLVDWEPDMRRSNTPLPKVEKEQVIDNNLNRAVSEFLTRKSLSMKFGGENKHYLNYKYDGSSIIAYYTPEGKLQKILGTPDQDWCMDRTRNCWNMFPHQINPGIECIQGEFLVDAGKYGELARNKANGLLNSKDMIDELEREGFIRAYQMRFYDGNWSLKRLRQELNDLPCIDRYRERFPGKLELDCVFREAEELTECPTESIITEYNRYTGCPYTTPKFQVDGVVVYYSNPEFYPHPSQAGGYHAFKFYFTESAVTTVTKVVWTFQDNGGYSCKLWFEPVTLNGKNISQVSSGGVPNLMAMKMGKGAKIRVILANMTIPKVVETIEPSENYEWPTCECGYQMSEKDIFGSTLKCQNDFCEKKYNHWKPWFADIFKDKVEPFEKKSALIENYFYILQWTLNIDRWDPKKNYKMREVIAREGCDPYEDLYSLIQTGTAEDFKQYIKHYYNLSYLSEQILNINVGTAFKILQDYLKE